MWRVFILGDEVMKYDKPALSFEQQTQRLLDRGLIVSNRDELLNCLRSVNYYRLSAYWLHFKRIDPTTGEERFAPDTRFNDIWRLYTFDHKLRLLIMDSIEHVEVCILRTRLVERFTLNYGPFGHTNKDNFRPEYSLLDFQRWMQDLNASVGRSKEDFLDWYKSVYTEERYIPLWIAAEVTSFGQLLTLFRNLREKEKKGIAKEFDLYSPVLESWLHTLNFVRNACAHHARLWNRDLPIRPRLPEKRHHPEWYNPVTFSNRRIFAVLTLPRYLMDFITPPQPWHDQLERLLREYPEIPTRSMGFPENWRECPIWKPTS
jgi:abortive infection bacteriophage resistance protein